MYVKVTTSGPRRYVQLVESFRDDDGRVKKRTVATLGLPDIEVQAVSHQQLLRSMDALMDNQDAVDGVVAGLLRPLVDRDLSIAFYDMTTTRAQGLCTVEGDVRKFGMAKEGLIAKQFMLGVVQTADGLPIYHEVFDGNTAEAKTLLPILKKVMERFPNLRRVILVAGRGLLSLDNLEELSKLRLSSGQALEFILAVPGRRYSEFVDLLNLLQQQCTQASGEITAELAWNGLRLVLAHDPATALEQRQKRQAKIDELQRQANAWVGKLDEQDLGAKKRGRKLSDSGAKVLKSELEIGPVYRRLPERIRAHASICFMALILHRVMRIRLRAGHTGITPERALKALKRIQHHRVSINGAEPLSGVSSISEDDSKMFKALRIKLPSQTQQMSLL